MRQLPENLRRGVDPRTEGGVEPNTPSRLIGLTIQPIKSFNASDPLSTTGQWSAIGRPVLFHWLFQLLLMTTSKPSKAPSHRLPMTDQIPVFDCLMLFSLLFEDLA